MLVTIEGTFKDGQVKLSETPQGLCEAKVLVTFLESAQSKPRSELMRFGQLSGPQDKMSTEEDFRCAEWRGDDSDEN
jgi:hypothetical protein